MAEITIKTTDRGEKWEFEVWVREGESGTEHRVTMSKEWAKKFSGAAPEEIVRKSFEFLLAREPKETILSEFEITLIGHYFPEYEKELASKVKP